MDKSPPPLSLAAALALPLPEGRRSSEVFVDGDLEVRLYAPKGHDPQPRHDRDELYVVAAGRGKFRVGDRVDPIAPGALLLALARHIGRQRAHEVVYELCMDAVEKRVLLKRLLLEDPRVNPYLGEADLDALLDPARYTGARRVLRRPRGGSDVHS